MKLISWNVNGLRAIVNKGLYYDYIEDEKPDFVCLQETKMQEGQADILMRGYIQFWNSALRKGYSGTVIFAKYEPLSVNMDIDAEGHSKEGRVITLEYDEFYLVNVYVPNSQEKLARIDYRMRWDDDFRTYVKKLDAEKPVIICGDMNVAHNEIDLKNPKTNRKNAGFSDEERGKFDKLLEAGFTDTFRYLYPNVASAYTWWSYRFNARANNAGWRIDYFLVSDRIKERILDVVLRNDIFGSDHCPVVIEIDI